MKLEDLLAEIQERVEDNVLHYKSEVLVTENMMLVVDLGGEEEEENEETPSDEDIGDSGYSTWKEEIFDHFYDEVLVAKYTEELYKEQTLLQTAFIERELEKDIINFFQNMVPISIYRKYGEEALEDFRDSLVNLISVRLYEDSQIKKLAFFSDRMLHDLIYDCINVDSSEEDMEVSITACPEYDNCKEFEGFEVAIMIFKGGEE